MNTPPEFALESVYDAQISPLMKQIIAICQKHKMPMMASFCYAKVNDEPGYLCTTSLTRDGWQPPEMNDAVHLIRDGFIAKVVISPLSQP